MKSKIVQLVNEVFKPHKVYLVGGSVRDEIMKRDQHDYDFCIKLNPDEMEEKLKGKYKTYKMGKRFGTIAFKVEGEMVEVTTFRSEEYEPGNRKPVVKYVQCLYDDLKRRDFTINAIAKLNNKILDPFGGREDIKNKIITCVGNPKARFKEDPLRLLRACRFAAQLNFTIEEDTFKKMERMSHHILDISKERWVMEMDKMLMSDNPEIGLNIMMDTKLLNFMIPEMSLQKDYDQNSKYHSLTLWEHTLEVVKATPKDLDLRWVALLHDIGKVFVKTTKYFKSPEEHKEYWKGINRDHYPNFKANYIKHELLGAEIVERISQYLKFSKERRLKVVSLIANHLNDNCPLREYDNLGKL